MSWDERTAKRIRHGILAALFFADERNYRLPLRDIREAVTKATGHDESLDRIRSEAAWLAEQGALVVDGQAAVLTARGADYATGRSVLPGVARPAPGELDDIRQALVAAGIAAAQAALRGG